MRAGTLITGVVVILVTYSLSAGIAGAAEEPGLVAHYTFDGIVDDLVPDATGNGNAGKLFNGTAVDSPTGKAVKFTKRSHAYMALESVKDLNVTGDMTFIAWVQIDADPVPDRTTNWTLIDCETHRKNGFIFRVSGDAQYCYYRASQADACQSGSTKTKLQNKQWHQVGFTRQGNKVTLFCDGRAETRIEPQLPAAPIRALQISSMYQSFVGIIDDVKLYKHALTPEQIKAQFTAQAGLYSK